MKLHIVILILFNFSLAEKDEEIKDPYDEKSTREYVEDVKTWAENMSPQHFRACDITEDLPQDHKTWQTLFRTVSCKSRNVIKK